MRRTVVSFAWGALDVARIEHAPDFAPDAGRRQVVFKLRANNPRRPVCSRHLTPHGSVHRPLLLRVRFVHVAEFLPQVKRRRRFVRNVFQFNQRRVFVLVRSRAFVPQNNATDVHSVVVVVVVFREDGDQRRQSSILLRFVVHGEMMMMARDQNEEDPKEKKREKKTEDAKSSPERHRATDVAPFAPRFLERANASRLRVPSPTRFF